MSKYAKGANFERQVIKESLEKPETVFAMRGAGSKSYGNIKVDVVILTKTELVLIQCKKSKSKYGKERKEFLKVKLPKEVKVTRSFIQVK